MPFSVDFTALAACRTFEDVVRFLANSLHDLLAVIHFYEPSAGLPFGATVRPSGAVSRAQIISIDDSINFLVANPDKPREGTQITLDFFNNEVVVGTVTFDTEYILNSAFQAPSTLAHAVYTFYRTVDGHWQEMSRSTALVGSPAVNFPTADFTFSVSGLAVTFTDASTDPVATITAWDWDFGDGSLHSFVQAPPAHTYVAGSYTVTLTVTNSQGNSNSASRPLTVAANQAPVAAFTVSKSGLTCTFTDQSTDADGSVVSWDWDFGDGSAHSFAQNPPAHTYGTAGTKVVTLLVTDNSGATDTEIKNVVVATSGHAPDCSWIYSVTGLAVQFTDQSTDPDNDIVSYAWTFGDGNTSTARNPAHTYASAGSRSVSLQVTDATSLSAGEAKTVTVFASTNGMPYGPIGASAWSNNVTLAPNMGYFDMNEGGIDASNVQAHINAANTKGIHLILAMTGGGHANYFFDPVTDRRFDRRKWNAKMEPFNTTNLRAVYQTAVSNRSVLAADVMDEPNVSGGATGDGNTWGPAGTMVKKGASTQQIWGLTVQGAHLAGATTLHCLSHPYAMSPGDRLVFNPGAGKTAVLTSGGPGGQISYSCDPLPVALANGDTAYSNSIDNMVAHVKVFFPFLAVGVTHKHSTFQPSVGYDVCDFLIDQYSSRFGDVTNYRNAGLNMGNRDGHRICFSINVLNGGDPIVGCPVPQTGGQGPQTGSCKVTPTQLLDWGRILTNADGSGRRTVGLLMWQYDGPFMNLGDNQVSFTTLRNELISKPRVSWYRP